MIDVPINFVCGDDAYGGGSLIHSTSTGTLTINANVNSNGIGNPRFQLSDQGSLVLAPGIAVQANVVAKRGTLVAAGAIGGNVTLNGSPDGVEMHVTSPSGVDIAGDLVLESDEFDKAHVVTYVPSTGVAPIRVAGTTELIDESEIVVDPAFGDFTAAITASRPLLATGSWTGMGSIAPVAFTTSPAPEWTITGESTASAYQVRVGEAVAPTAPALASSSHTVNVANTASTASLAITGASDAHSGIAGYHVQWSNSATPGAVGAVTHAGSGDLAITSLALAVGSWYAHVATIDRAGNASPSTTFGPIAIASATTGGGNGTTGGGNGSTGGGNGTTGGGSTGGGDPAPKPKPPVAPKAAQVLVVGGLKSHRFSSLAKGSVRVSLPVRAAKVRATVMLRVSAARARKLGLRVPKRAKFVTLGTGTVTSKKAGRVIVTVRLNKAARAAMTRAGARRSKLKTVAAQLHVTLTSGKLRAKPVLKAITLRK